MNIENQIIINKHYVSFSDRLKLLLLASKKKDVPVFDRAFIADTLAKVYHPKISYSVAVHHCVSALVEAYQYDKFELPHRENLTEVIEQLVLAPVKSKEPAYCFIDNLDPKTTMTIEEHYNSIISHIMILLRLTRIDWCRDQLGLEY